MKRILTGMIVFLSLLSFHSISQETIKQKTINVSGIAEMEIVPDEIFIQVELREYDKKGGSKVDIDAIKTNFLKAAVSTGISENDIVYKATKGGMVTFGYIKKIKRKILI